MNELPDIVSFLPLLVMIGGIGPLAIYGDGKGSVSTLASVLAWGWFALWAAPPVVMLWIHMVLG